MEKVDLKKLISIFKELVAIYSPSKGEKDVCEYLVKYLQHLGCQIYLDESQNIYGGNCPTIFAKLEGSVKGEGVTFSAHMDVVEPNRGVEIIEDGDIIRTNGKTTLGGDDKAGIAVILYVLEYLTTQKIAHEDIYCIFTPGEEVGMLGARNIQWDNVYLYMNPAKNMIVLDNAGKSEYIAHQAPTCSNFEIQVHGKKAHAGIEPENGISAIQVLAEIISQMKILRIDEYSTANISFFASDFPTNVVPDLAQCKGELRAHDDKKIEEMLTSYEKICQTVCDKYGATYDFQAIQAYPLLKSKDDLAFAKAFQASYQKIGVDSKLQIIGGGSDANFFAEEGFNAIIIGVGMQNVHTTEEYLEVLEMKKAAEVVLEYLNER